MNIVHIYVADCVLAAFCASLGFILGPGAGMTRTVYLFLFYEHCSGLCYLLFFKSSYRRRSVSIAPQGPKHHYPVHCVDTPSPAKGIFTP